MDFIFKLGLILLFSIPLARISQAFKLPKVLGYLIGGLLFGPYVLKIVNEHFLVSMTPFNSFALAYILFLVGTKLKIEHLKGSIKIVLNVLLFQFFLTFVLVSIFVFPLFRDIKVALFIGLIGVTIAPASTIAVIDELDAEGPVTSALLLLIVINDLLVLYLFSAFLPIVFKEKLAGGIPYHFYIITLKYLVSSIIGIVVGFFLTYIEVKTKNELNMTILALGTVLSTIGVLEIFHLNPYVGAFFIGFIASNASIKHKKILKELELFDNLIYIIFFFVSGASMHLNLLIPMLPGVILYVIARGAGQYIGAYKGALRGGADKWEARALGMGILTQAGLAIGFALILGSKGGAGIKAMNLILSSTIVFEIGGIILLKKGLLMAGEIKLSRIVEMESKPLWDFHFDEIFSEFLKQIGVSVKSRKAGELRVHDLMLRNFNIIKPEMKIKEIITIFEKSRCHTLPVIDDNENLVGVINLRDLEQFVLDRAIEHLIVAEDLVRLNSPCLSAEMSLMDAYKIFKAQEVDALPVCENNHVIGMLMRKDILRFIK